MLMAHQGVFITSPEYSALGDAASEKRDRLGVAGARGRRTDLRRLQKPGLCHRFGDGQFGSGGVRSMMALRQILELGCGALVIPEQVSVPRAEQAFDDARQSEG